MNDTPPDAAARFASLLRERSGSDRVRMVSDMFDTARALVIASVKAQRPDISEVALRVEVFKRFYANDFSPEELAAIVRRLEVEQPQESSSSSDAAGERVAEDPGSAIDDSLYRARAVGSSTDRRTAAEHDTLLYDERNTHQRRRRVGTSRRRHE